MVVRDVVDVLGRDRYPGSAMTVGAGLQIYLQAYGNLQFRFLHTKHLDLEMVAVQISRLLNIPVLPVNLRRYYTFKKGCYILPSNEFVESLHNLIFVTNIETEHFFNVDELIEYPNSSLTVDILEVKPTFENLQKYKRQCRTVSPNLRDLEKLVQKWGPRKGGLNRIVVDLSRYLLVAYYVSQK